MKPASEFADIELRGFKNPNELFAGTNLTIQDQLHPGETLFGDLKAEVLLLAQDPACFNKLMSIVRNEGVNGYRHGKNVKTNVRLKEILNAFADAKQRCGNNRNCGLFYANAIWLLKDEESMSAEIKTPNLAYERCEPVFKETVSGLDQLKLIIALGAHAYKFLGFIDKSLLPSRRCWQQLALSGDKQEFMYCKGSHKNTVYVATTYHPVAYRTDNVERLKNEFRTIFKNADLSPSIPVLNWG